MILRHLAAAACGVALAVAMIAACNESPTPPADDGVGGTTDTSSAVVHYVPGVVIEYPHSNQSLTQGLIWADTALIEGTGFFNGSSKLMRVDLITGTAIAQRTTPIPAFGEGVTQVGNRVVQLTWTEQVAFQYDAVTFDTLRTLRYRGEGWGLTHDSSRFIMSNGSDTLFFRDLDTFAEVGRVAVTADRIPVRDLNELEFINGLVWANVFEQNRIVMIDPATGRVIADLDGTSLRTAAGLNSNPAFRPLNGIAWDAPGGRVFVTGKQWSKLFHITLKRVASP